MGDALKYCGILKDTDIYNVQQQIVASGVLTSEEISMFGLDDK